jgi:hypothetical protein
MKLFVGTFLLSAGASPVAAFIPQPEYLHSELATFANEKLVGGSLARSSFETSTMLSWNEQSVAPTPSSVFGGASDFMSKIDGAGDFMSKMVADIGNPLATIQEAAMNAASATSGHWDVSSSVLASNLMSNIDFTPESLVPSMIMMTSMAITILVSDKQSSTQEHILESAPTTTSNAIIANEIEVVRELPSANDNYVVTSMESLHQAFAPSKMEPKTAEVVASSAAAVAFADAVLASTDDYTYVAAEETASVQTIVVAEKEEKKVATVKSSLFSQARRMKDSVVLKVTNWLLQGRLFVRTLVALIQKLQKSTVSAMVAPTLQAKPVLVVEHFLASSRGQQEV